MTSGVSRRLSRALGLALLVLLLAGPSGAAELELYQPRHRPAAELVPLVQGLLGSDGAVVADPHTGKLVLSGSPAAVQQTLQALRKLDVLPRQYRIVARATSEEELSQRGFEIHGWLELGDLRIGRIRSGFRLRPRSLAQGAVELEIAAVVEEESPYGKRVQAFADARVRLEPDEEIVIAEIRRQGTDVQTVPYATQQESYTSDTLVWVRVSSEGSGPRP